MRRPNLSDGVEAMRRLRASIAPRERLGFGLTALFAISCFCFAALARRPQTPPTFETFFVALASALFSYFVLLGARAWRLRAEKDVATVDLAIHAGGAVAAQTLLTLMIAPPALAPMLAQWGLALAIASGGARSTWGKLLAETAYVALVALHVIACDQLFMTGDFAPAVAPFIVFIALGAAAHALLPQEHARPAPPAVALTAGMTAAGLLAVALIASLLAFLATGLPALWFLPAALLGAAGFLTCVLSAMRPSRTNVQLAANIVGVWLGLTYVVLGAGGYFLRFTL